MEKTTNDIATKIDLLCHEKREMRDEILEMQKSMHRVVFAFISISLAMIGTYFTEYITKNPEFKGYLAFFLMQAQLSLALFLTSLISHQSVSAGYIAAIEMKINEIVGEKLSFFETTVAPRYLFSPHGPFFYSTVLIVLTVVVVMVFLLISGYKFFPSLFISILLTVELLIYIALLGWSFAIGPIVKKYSAKIMIK